MIIFILLAFITMINSDLTLGQIKNSKEVFKLVSKAKSDPKDIEKLLNDYKLPINVASNYDNNNLFIRCARTTSNLNMLKWLYENGLNDDKTINDGFLFYVEESTTQREFEKIFDWFEEIGARLEFSNIGNDTYKYDISRFDNTDINFIKIIYILTSKANKYDKHKIKKIVNYIEKYYDINKKHGIYKRTFIHYFIILGKLNYTKKYLLFEILNKDSKLYYFNNDINYLEKDVNGNTYLHLYIDEFDAWLCVVPYIYDYKLLTMKNKDGDNPLMILKKLLETRRDEYGTKMNLMLKKDYDNMSETLENLGYNINNDVNNFL